VNDQAHPDHSAEEHRHGHESSDVSIRAIALFGLGLILVGVFIHFLLIALMNAFSDQLTGPAGLARPLSDILNRPSDPLLQDNPADELAKMRAAEAEALNKYGWIDKSRGVVRIPIDRAIDLVAERGLPVRVQAPAEQKKEK
jgi:hypothetical protein